MQIIETEIVEKRWVGLVAGPGGHVHWTDLRLLARAEGFVMVRHHGETPRVMDEAEWETLPTMMPVE
jgi:hypothetical protein